jgi:tetratricopeptide (TPR) repeat protein
MIHNFKKSIEHYQIALENLNKDKNFASILYRNYCICLIEIGEFSQALKLLDKGLTYFNDYPDLYFLKGQIHGNLGLLQKAKKYFLRCIQFEKIPFFYTTTTGVTSYIGLENLAGIFAKEKNYSKALTYLTKSIKSKLSYDKLLKLCIYLQQNNYNGAEIIDYIENNFNQCNEHIIAQLLLDCGEINTCIKYINKTQKTGEFLLIQAKALIANKSFKKAEKILINYIQYNELNKEALKQLCICSWLRTPRKNNNIFLLKYKSKKNNTFKACKLINDYIFNTKIKQGSIINKKIINELNKIVLKVLSLGDENLAFLIAKIISFYSKKNPLLILVKIALDNGYYYKAKLIFEKSFKKINSTSEGYFLFGEIYKKLKLYPKAFSCYNMALNMKPKKKIYNISLLEVTLNQFKLLLLSNHNLKNKTIQKYLLKITSYIKKTYRIKGVD